MVRWIKWLVALPVVALFWLPVHWRPFHFPADDAYFYLQVAANIASGHGSTFNQITATNGYHPLWMVFCTLGTALGLGEASRAVHIVFLMQQLLALGTILLVLKALGRLHVRHRLLAAPVLAAFFWTGLFGSEAHINGFFVALALTAVLEPIAPGRALRRYFLVGLLTGLAMLARLDNIFFAAMLMGGFWLNQSRPWRMAQPHATATWLGAGLACGGFALVILPYLTLNLARFGHLMPISGAIKSTFPHPVWSFSHLGTLGQICFGFALLTLAWTAERWRRDPAWRFLPPVLGLSVILHGLYVCLFTRDVTHWSWYYVLGVINIACVGAMLADDFERRCYRPLFKHPPVPFKLLVHLAVALMLAVGLGRVWVRAANPDAIYGRNVFTIHHKKSAERWQISLAHWLGDNLPGDARLLVYDWPGMLAFHSGLSILPVDGLINDYQYNEDLLREGVTRYLATHGVDYWLGPDVETEAYRPGWYHIRRRGSATSVEVFSPLYKRSAGEFVAWDSQRIIDFKTIIDHPDMPHLALWALPRQQAKKTIRE